MSKSIVVTDPCLGCGGDVQFSDNYCSGCGRAIERRPPPIDTEIVQGGEHALVAVARPVSRRSDPRSSIATLLENRSSVLAILLCAGPLGLPALWFSRRFSRRAKILTTIGYFLLTAVIPLAIAWYFLDFAVRPLVETLRR